MKTNAILIAGCLMALACGSANESSTAGIDSNGSDPAGYQPDSLPPPYASESVKNFSKVIGWPQGKTPQAPEGFVVTRFADGLNNPRAIYQAPNGDIFVALANTENKSLEDKLKAEVSGKAESQNLGNSSNTIILLRDENNDGIPEVKKEFITSGLDKPYGMLVIGNSFYVANTGGLLRFDYPPGSTSLTGAGKKILELPAGGYNNHWTRNLIANADNSKIYISVGSASNVGEHGMQEEVRRAAILEINPDGSGERIYGSGLRNPVGMDWAPGTQTLWTSVNERDELGDNLVPDYLTSVQPGGFYGWPYAYIGQHVDPRMKDKRSDLVEKTIVPEVLLGAHTASLGLAFYDQNSFPASYHGGAFIGQHGSWNRSQLAGYKVVFVPFTNGKPTGKPQEFLNGFVADAGNSKVYGRPVDVCVLKNGSMLVSDDAANTVWHIAYKGN